MLVKNKKILLVFIVVVLATAGGGYALWHNHKNSKPKQVKLSNGKAATANPNVPSSSNNSVPPSEGVPSSKDNGANQPASTLAPDIQPKVPVGDFVSNHYPNLSGHPHPYTETSACTTTPGATCQITFTAGTTVKSLPAQTTNADGSTAWYNWTLQSVGLTKGTWAILAVAANGSKIAYAKDDIQLVVAQ